MNALPVSAICYTLISRCLRPFPYRSQSVSCFPHKVFPQSTHWVQSRPQLVLHFLASFPTFSCSAVYKTRLCVYLCFIRCLFFLPIFSQAFTAFVLSSNSFRDLPSTFLPSLSSSVFRSSSFPSCRAHNCITERLFSRLTLSSHPHSLTFLAFPSRHVPIDPGTELYYLFISTAERTKRTTGTHQG